MKTLVAPLNWGLGHASRCVALVRRLLASGDDVVIGGDGESLVLLRQHFPELRYVELAPLELRYSRGNSQMWAMLASIPKVLRWMIHDHRRLQEIQRVEQFDRIVSDNRFGCWVDDDVDVDVDVDVDDDGGVVTVYMTHQVHICLPCGWQWADGVASRIHACVYNKYKELWIPDYEEEERSLAGRLSHGERGKREMGKGKRGMEKYIGPLSRFESLDVARIKTAEPAYDVVAVLSGLEPQRTMLEETIRSWAVRTPEERVLIVRGKVRSANENVDVDVDDDVDGNVVMVDSMGDEELARVMMGAKRIIVRSGYSTIMDLACLGLLDKAELIPTPGQSEQEYLKRWIEKITNK